MRTEAERRPGVRLEPLGDPRQPIPGGRKGRDGQGGGDLRAAAHHPSACRASLSREGAPRIPATRPGSPAPAEVLVGEHVSQGREKKRLRGSDLRESSWPADNTALDFQRPSKELPRRCVATWPSVGPVPWCGTSQLRACVFILHEATATLVRESLSFRDER